MEWHELNHSEQLTQLDQQSSTQPILIYKHSTRCGVSLRAKRVLESDWTEQDSARVSPYYLDLLQHRDVSNAIAAHYGIHHESPQVLLIKDGKCVYSASHHEIDVRDIRQAAQATA